MIYSTAFLLSKFTYLFDINLLLLLISILFYNTNFIYFAIDLRFDKNKKGQSPSYGSSLIICDPISICIRLAESNHTYRHKPQVLSLSIISENSIIFRGFCRPSTASIKILAASDAISVILLSSDVNCGQHNSP